jgi:hypothetical protein
MYKLAYGATSFATSVALIWFLYALEVGIEARLDARAQFSQKAFHASLCQNDVSRIT